MLRLKRAGSGTGNLYVTLVSVSALLAVTGMLFMVPHFLHVRTVLITAAQNGARVAAITGDEAQVRRVVERTIQDAKLPTQYKGVTLFSISNTQVQSGVRDPLATVKVQYQAPTLFPNLFAILGKPNSLPVSIPMSVTQSYVNETYFGSGGYEQ